MKQPAGAMVRCSIALALVFAAMLAAVPAGAAAGITVNPTNLDFGEVAVGSSKNIAVVITNTGSAAATPNYAGGAPNDPTHFGGSQNCAGVTLDPGDTCEFTYDFTPTATGTWSTNTTIGIDADDYAITLTGTSGSPTTTTTTTTAPTTTTLPDSGNGGNGNGGGSVPVDGGTATTIAGSGTVKATVEHDEVAPGESESASASGYEPQELVSGVMQPDGTDLGSRVADDQGVARFEWKIPDDAELGKRQFVATGATSGTATVEFTVAESDSDASPWLIVAIVVGVLLIVAAIAYFINRRRHGSDATVPDASSAPPAAIDPTEPMKPVDPTDP